MITEDYISFETAKLLKEKGFDNEVKSFYSYDSEFKTWELEEDDRWDTPNNWGSYYCSAPTLQMAMKWLREKEWFICIIPLAFYCGERTVKFGYNIWAGDNLEIDESSTPKFNTYEDAAEAAIRYCLEKLI